MKNNAVKMLKEELTAAVAKVEGLEQAIALLGGAPKRRRRAKKTAVTRRAKKTVPQTEAKAA